MQVFNIYHLSKSYCNESGIETDEFHETDELHDPHEVLPSHEIQSN
jgi:hypothetical protein